MGRDGPADRVDVGQLALAVEAIQDGVAVYDAQARIVLVNERLLAITGYARQELVGQMALVLIPESLREELTPRMLAYADAPVPRALGDGLTSRIARKDGSTFDAEVANFPLHSFDGHLVVSSIRAIRDVSLEEIKLRGMLEANPDATMVCSPEGRIILSNAGAIRLFEREHIALFNQPLTSLFPSTYAPTLEKELCECHESAVAGELPAHTHSLELELVRADESVMPVEATITSLRTAQGLTLRVIVRDISERRRLQHEAEAKKDGFLATVSHELRTPLTSVLGYGELLEDLGEEDLSDHARSLLDVVVRNARRELRLVDDLLTMVQIGEGGFRLQPGHLDFYDLVLNAVEAAAPVAQRAEVHISVVKDDKCMPVVGDADRLGQAVDNLLTNSLKFSPAGGEVSVVLAADAGANSILLSITNEGVGIRAADVEHVFDRLYRGGNAVEAEKQGIGLGLSIVRSIVEAHRGDVSVRCTPTTTCFEVTLPRAPQVTAPGPVPTRQGAPLRTPGPAAG
jgi:PAS domain S-box-containing protein